MLIIKAILRAIIGILNRQNQHATNLHFGRIIPNFIYRIILSYFCIENLIIKKYKIGFNLNFKTPIFAFCLSYFNVFANLRCIKYTNVYFYFYVNVTGNVPEILNVSNTINHA